MERFIELCQGEVPGAEALDCVALSFAQREKARQRVALQSGEEIIINIRRGQVMRGGNHVKSPAGRCVMVKAAAETVSTVRCDDPLQLTRVAYHLGNRHVWLQVGDGWLRYLHDHVLDDMVHGLGGSVAVEEAPFEPEAGAYGGHGHHQH